MLRYSGGAMVGRCLAARQLWDRGFRRRIYGRRRDVCGKRWWQHRHNRIVWLADSSKLARAADHHGDQWRRSLSATSGTVERRIELPDAVGQLGGLGPELDVFQCRNQRRSTAVARTGKTGLSGGLISGPLA